MHLSQSATIVSWVCLQIRQTNSPKWHQKVSQWQFSMGFLGLLEPQLRPPRVSPKSGRDGRHGRIVEDQGEGQIDTRQLRRCGKGCTGSAVVGWGVPRTFIFTFWWDVWGFIYWYSWDIQPTVMFSDGVGERDSNAGWMLAPIFPTHGGLKIPTNFEPKNCTPSRMAGTKMFQNILEHWIWPSLAEIPSSYLKYC